MNEDSQNNQKEVLGKYDPNYDKQIEQQSDHIEVEYPDTAEADYAYLYIANRDDHPFGDNILSFEEFCIANYHDESSYKDVNVNRLSFVANPGALASGVAIGVQRLTQASNSVRMARSQFKEAVGAVQAIKGEADQFLNVLSGNTDTGEGGGGSGGDGGGYTTNNSGTFARMDVSPNPTEVRLNTGINPNCYSPYYHDATSVSSPLHTYHNMLAFGSMDVNDKTSIFFDTVLATLFQIAAQKNISFNVNSSTVFDKTALKAYFNTVAKALQYYYFATSVVTYTDSALNKNAGMYALRSMMSADNIDSLYAISRLIRGVPIPPNINHICFYLMQTYSQGTLPGSSLIKIIPHVFINPSGSTPFAVTNLNLSVDYAAVLNEMTTQSFKDISSMLARIAPGWIMPDLMTPSPVALHDLQFNTIWSNAPTEEVNTAGVANIVPSTANNLDTTFPYAIHTNELDGFVFALGSIYNTTTSKWTPSLWKQGLSTIFNTTYYSNKWSFIDYGGTNNPFFIAAAFCGNSVAFSRGSTYTTVSGFNTIRPFGTQVGLNYSANSVKETTQKAYEWIMNIDELANQSNKTNMSRNNNKFASNSDRGDSNGRERFQKYSKKKK